MTKAELMDAIARRVTEASGAARVLQATVETDEARAALEDILECLGEVADDWRAASSSGLLCEVYEAEQDAAKAQAEGGRAMSARHDSIAARLIAHLGGDGTVNDSETDALYRAWFRLADAAETDLEAVEEWAVTTATLWAARSAAKAEGGER